MKKLIVFDLDGTLVDSIGDIADAMNRSLRELKCPTHAKEKYYQMVGDGMETLCRRALPDADEETQKALIALYREDYLQNCCRKTKPYPGIAQLLFEIKEKGRMLAIISNKPQAQTRRVVAEVLQEDSFDWVLGQRENFPKKPDPAALFSLMSESGVKAEETLYVGDSNVDIQFGYRAGVDTVGVAWGFRGERELLAAKAARIVHDVSELQAIIFADC